MRSLAEAWLRTLAGLGDYVLQVSYARNELDRQRQGVLAESLNAICQRAEQGEVAARDALGAFIPSVVDIERLDRVRSLRATAISHKMLSVARLLRASTPSGHHLDRHQRDAAGEIIEKSDGRPVTLGERRALARQPSRATLDRLLRDPHPMVARLLLKNPRITENDVVRMAAFRPANAAITVEIAKAWSRRARVRMTLAQNPGVPPAVSVPLLTLMTRPELEQIARAADLPAVVRATALELVELRPPLASDRPPGPGH